jgi:FtsP/CotA-like multicopper oxidase with cupredoxin domain
MAAACARVLVPDDMRGPARVSIRRGEEDRRLSARATEVRAARPTSEDTHMAKRDEHGEATKLSRRDVLRLGAVTGAAGALGAVGLRPTPAAASSGSGSGGSGSGSGSGSSATGCSGLQAIEAYPTSPLLLEPFRDPLPIPRALRPVDPAVVATWRNPPGAGPGQQDSAGGTHQLWPGHGVVSGYSQPAIYQIKVQVASHSFSSSPVQRLISYRDAKGNPMPAGTVLPRLPESCIYGFNGQFPGPMVNAEYGKPVILRFENHLDENPGNYDRQDFGAPDWKFLTHLHNAHTAPESDGNPHHKPDAYGPGEWVDNLYLNYPAGGDETEKQSFFWFHDHRMDHTGANVYKGMAGIFPIYDRNGGMDMGDETQGLRLPGVRTTNPDGTFDVDYDVPLVFYDVRFDDGATPHQDFHNGCGEAHPEWWGKTFFRHFPNHGFVGDVFTTNGIAYPYMEVKRRKYRFRLLTAAISRDFELQLMTSRAGPRSAVSLGYSGDELQGQHRIPDGQQCMRFTEIATGGGLLPNPIVRDSIENWPAMRHEIVVDFTRYMDGTPTRKGDVIYLTNIMKMVDGRKPSSGTRFALDRAYKIPMVKFVVGDDAPDQSDPGLSPLSFNPGKQLRKTPTLPSNWQSLPRRTFELQRGGFGGEIQWLINGHPFDPTVPLATVKRGQPEVWTIRNGGGGWTHPMHLHMEEHRILTRDDKPATSAPGHADDTGKDDVIALDASETVVLYRNFRTYVGNYVAHCHNLAHEDHAMMFGWTLSA